MQTAHICRASCTGSARRSSLRSGGQHVATSLQAFGARLVFCVPGESYLPLLDGLYDLKEEITVITCRHEHGAAIMAEAYGKLTGQPGICLVTRGPGACNASIGVHTAFQDSTPLIVVVGQAPRPFLGREAFQEVDLVQMFAPLAKHAVQVEKAADLPQAFATAWRKALSGRPGPVVLAVPEDVFAEHVDAFAVTPLPAMANVPDPGLMERLHHVLGDAERPLMIVGGGGWTERARHDIVAFAAANGVPTCCTFRRHDVFDNEHPSFVGELGIGPDPALVARINAADLILAVGTRLGEIPTQHYRLLDREHEGQALVHVYPDPRELGRVFRADLGICAGVAEFAAAARALTPVDGRRWRVWAADGRSGYVENRNAPPQGGELDLPRIMGELDRRLPATAVVTVDAGNFSGWPQRYLTFGSRRRLLGPINGAMGYGVPAAVAAKILLPERMVVACVGDGGFGMTGQELATAVRYGVDPLILVFDNGIYGTIRMHQETKYPKRVMATGLTNPDFAALARAYGAHGETVSRTEDFAPALERAVAAGKAAVIALKMDPDTITTRTTLSTIRRAALEHQR